MSTEQKLAFANYCDVAFPCQDECAQDFRQPCPSLWRDIGGGICQAPVQYEGSCAMRLDVAGMSEDDKYVWSVRCGARWQCAAQINHNYDDMCPLGWFLHNGNVCRAPSNYTGPCEPLAYMNEASVAEKKSYEATCRVEWRGVGEDCVHDFHAPCPFGWFEEASCVAPSTYHTCSTSPSFRIMTPAAKEDWAQTCKVKFPCRERDTCEKTYAAPCPANWYAFNAGLSCVAPSNYNGSCVPVLHGLVDLPVPDKRSLETKCNFEWPCFGEVYSSILQPSGGSTTARRSVDPAQYSLISGPIDGVSGAIQSSPRR